MMAVLLIVGGFLPLSHAAFPLSILSTDDQVITGRFFDSLLLSLPPCRLAGQNVDLEYRDFHNNKTYILHNIFTVPYCNFSGDAKGSSALSRNIGYQLMNLTDNTQYSIFYKIGNHRSNPVMATTRIAVKYTDIELTFQGRSASMVVITVLLIMAVCILLISIIISNFVSPNEE